MRDPRKRRTTRESQRRRRRLFLSMLMMAPTTALADGPEKNTSIRMSPPLPLQSIDGTDLVHSNPFCEATDKTPVQLASGDKSSSIKLKPIGAAIGLQSIGGKSAAEAATPTMTIEAIGPPAVRSNPLVESTHHDNQDLIDTAVEDRTEVTASETPAQPQGQSSAASEGGSSIVLIAPKPAQPAMQPPAGQLTAPAMKVPTDAFVERGTSIPQVRVQMPQSMLPAPTIADTSIAQTPPVALSPEAAPALPAVPAAELANEKVAAATDAAPEPSYASNPQAETFEEPKEIPAPLKDEAIFFSLSDNAEPSEPQADSMDAAAQTEPETPTLPIDALANDAEVVVDMDDPVEPKSPVALGVVDPIALGEPASGEPASGEPESAASLAPIESVINNDGQAPIAIYRSEPKVSTAPTPTVAESLRSRRYRPPVAVTPVPLALEREPESLSDLASSTVHSVQAINLEGSHLDEDSARKTLKPTPLYMSRAQVRSLTVGGEVRKVTIEDTNVCEALAAGPNKLKLIGTGNGVTRLVVWADSADINSPTRVRAFDIHVRDAVHHAQSEIGTMKDQLNQSIRRAFPQCDVAVLQRNGQLLVSGRCDSQSSATKIIRMVRKACLIPVQDHLVVQ